MSERQAAFDRILELGITTADGAQTVSVDSVTYYRNRQSLDDGNGFSPGYSGGAAAASPVEVELAQTLPPPTVIRVSATINA